MLPFHAEVIQGPSVEEWVLGTLRERGPQTLDQLGASLPNPTGRCLAYPLAIQGEPRSQARYVQEQRVARFRPYAT